MEKKATKFKAIIWDLGNVLIDWNPRYVYDTLIPDEEKRKHFFEHICTMDWNEQQDAGYSIQKATEELVLKHPDLKEYIEAYYSRWEEMLGGPIEGTVEIFKELKENPQLRHFALTNWSHELFPTALRLYHFLHWFDGRVVSGEEGMRKPDTAFYKILLNRYSLHAVESLFIDDNLRNVKAAEALGITCIHFQSPGQLSKVLKEFQLL